MSEALVMTFTAGLFSLLLAAISVLLYRLLTQLDANSELTTDTAAKVVLLTNCFARVENDLIEARKLQTEFAILRAEFYRNKKPGGNGKSYCPADGEH